MKEELILFTKRHQTKCKAENGKNMTTAQLYSKLMWQKASPEIKCTNSNSFLKNTGFYGKKRVSQPSTCSPMSKVSLLLNFPLPLSCVFTRTGNTGLWWVFNLHHSCYLTPFSPNTCTNFLQRSLGKRSDHENTASKFI